MNMPTNPALRALGYSDRDRVVIFHADDLGMAEATISAYHDLLDTGLLSSAAIMMPCAWAAGAGQAVRAHPGADVGVHLTLTSEWDTCRWGPLTAGSSLQDAEGYLFHTVDELHRHAQPAEVIHEVRTQLERALAWGLPITHADTHMGAVGHPNYVQSILALALEKRIPLMFPRLSAAEWQATGLTAPEAEALTQLAREAQEQGLPLIDHIRMLPLDHANDHEAVTLQMLRDLPPGITHFILHPARDTPELRAFAADWPARVENYRAFTSAALKREVQNLGIQIIGYRPLQELLKKALGDA